MTELIINISEHPSHLLGLIFLRLPVAGDGVEQSLPQDVDVVSQGQSEK